MVTETVERRRSPTPVLRTGAFVAANAGGDRAGYLASFGISAFLHLLLLLGLAALTARGALELANDLGVGTGIGAGPAGGGGGGDEGIAYLNLPEPMPATPAVPASAEAVIPEIEAPPPIAIADPAAFALADIPAPALALAGTGGRGAGQGSGTGPGRGPGYGGGYGGGEGGGIGSGVGPGVGRGRQLGPTPRALLLPPVAPGSVRGDTVVARLHVDSLGVVRDVELVAPTRDLAYNEKLRAAARGWRFQPARNAGNHPIPAVFEVTFIL